MIRFCGAYSDFNLRVYHTNLDQENDVHILSGHTNYINAIAWETNGQFLASVSDDHTCVIWSDSSKNYKKKSVFYLTSPGVDVKWHSDKPLNIFVGEKCGRIRLYNVEMEQAILSFETGQSPLVNIDWSPTNSNIVAGIVAGKILIWNIQKPTQSMYQIPAHVYNGVAVKFCPINENLIASIGRPQNKLKISCLKTQTNILEVPIQMYRGFSWHHNLPYFIVGQDRKLTIWPM